MEKNEYSQLMEKAVSSDNLVNRAAANRTFAKNDFNKWVGDILENLAPASVLDVCCGTGNQLILYAAKPGVDRLVGIDVSREALDTARKRLDNTTTLARISLIDARMEEMFAHQGIKDEHFDVISCFYGLYYAENVSFVLNGMIDRLRDGGSVVITGPYGMNNAGFFSLLERHYKLPELVVRSATTFMEKEVCPILEKRCRVEARSFVNKIVYPGAASLMKYWRSSTFYSPEHEAAVKKDVENHFSGRGDFTVEKHVLAYIARRA